jgi:hypothetical protein
MLLGAALATCTPDAVAAVEAVAGRPQVHLHGPYALGVGGDLRGQDPADAVADVHRPAPGIHVAQAHHHVGVLHAGAHVHPWRRPGPTTSSGAANASVVKTSTSGRASTLSCRTRGLPRDVGPPSAGVASAGS